MASLSCKHAGWCLVVDGLWGGSVAGGAVSRPEDVTEKKKDKRNRWDKVQVCSQNNHWGWSNAPIKDQLALSGLCGSIMWYVFDWFICTGH